MGVRKLVTSRADGTPLTAKLVRALEKRGVTFTARGLEFSETPTFFVEGATHEATYLQLLEDAAEALKGALLPELLIMYGDDRVSPPSVRAMYREMRAGGVAMRQLVEDGNTYLMGPPEEYRYVPQRFFINRVTLIYGDRVATVGSDRCRIVVQADPIQADVERNTFNMLWDVLEQPAVSEADERF